MPSARSQGKREREKKRKRVRALVTSEPSSGRRKGGLGRGGASCTFSAPPLSDGAQRSAKKLSGTPTQASLHRLLDEEHLLVLGQGPEVVGDDLLQLVGRLADV